MENQNNSAIRGALRRLFARSPIVRDALKLVRRTIPKYNKDGSRAKVDAVQYLCATCNVWTKSTAVSVDHIEPVIDVTVGFVDWNTYIGRLFCGPENLSVKCKTCHEAKTYAERIARLRNQYTLELDDIEKRHLAGQNVKPEITRFCKKKVDGLEDIVTRARAIRDAIKK